ncbi:MAG TPA: J domain-containing protein [Candidatus Limnocylindria bacterium]|jgi:curved DNA-binding protein CbpA|nr:J domain-containing protein [Candidatus Limnocylindria bacterium]
MPNRTVLDPYAVLGVSRDATALQVARARRRLAKRFHPDLHPGEDVSESMRRVNEAWYILSSSVRRAAYDYAHPRAGTPSAGHWAASRPEIRPMTPNTTRSWASWRTTAEETQAAPRTRRQPGEIPVVSTRRPPPIAPQQRTFRDSGWAAVLVGVVVILLLVAAVVAGKLS